MRVNEKQSLQEYFDTVKNLANATPVDLSESSIQKDARIKKLEADPEAWFKYYFPKYATSEPADFHKEATKRVLSHPEWYEVRNWSRELAKSTRTMMEVLYLTLTKKKFNCLIISNSQDNAQRLLLPYQVNLENNQRIINDYGEQKSIGSWETGEFITASGAAFRALGAGQSPRGTRNEAIRPDIIIFDDLDTDEDCRNLDIIDKRWEWVSEAVIPTRSISNPLLVIWCGNIIAEDCCVVRAKEYADHVDVVNIRDAEGKSSWAAKNSEADIDRVLSLISYAAQQKEYFNNPMATGKTFPEITWGKCPPLHSLPLVITYADPATSNKDKPGQKSNLANSRKAVFTVGSDGHKFYIYTGFLDVMSNANFIRSLYACRQYIESQLVGAKPRDKSAQGEALRATPAYYYIENNTLQDPFYTQVLLPLIYSHATDIKEPVLPITPDPRKKDDKWFRIEAMLEPLNRTGRLIFNIEEENNEHMKRLVAQFKSAKPTSKQLDGPDAIEGAIFILQNKLQTIQAGTIQIINKPKTTKNHF